MKIIIDAMGGDNAPREIVRGALDAHEEFGVDIVLVGKQEAVREAMASAGWSECPDGVEIIDARDIITMEDDPTTATRRKKDSSMAVALTMLKEGKGDAVVSAGSTGALLTGATLTVKRIRGIRRAAMAPVLPNGGKGVLLMDCGANVECTPEYLLQFAYMGSFYSENILGVESPRVALLNVGTEDTKGGQLQKSAFALLKEAGDEGRINFIGNAEGSDIFSGKVDVMVTDGFSGNVMLKTIEGTAKYMSKLIKGVFYKNIISKLSALLVKDGLKQMKSSMDVSEVGGTAMLGISKPVIKAHGSSDARAIRSAVKQAISVVEANITEEISANIEYMKISAADAD